MKEWLVDRVVRRLNDEPGRSLLRQYQDVLLHRTLRHASLHSPFYRSKFAELGLSPALVRGQSDLPELGFFTTGADLRANPFDFLAVPKRKVVHIMATSGTTGQSKLTFYSKRDWESLVTRVYAGLILARIGEEEVAQIMFASGTPAWMGGSLLQAGLAKRGCMIVPKGNAPSPAEQIRAMVAFGTTYLYGTPSYLHRVTAEGKEITDLRSLGIKGIYLGAEPNSKAFRNYLDEAWGTKTYDGYGMAEMGMGVGGECSERNGIHVDLYIAVEVVNPETGEPRKEGEAGELVFTTLGREATPLIRYRSGDIARLLPDEPCPCGMLPTRKISNVLGRTDDLMFLGSGENFYPDQLDQVMVGIEGVTGYQLVVGKDGYKDTLLFRIETASPSPELAARITERLYSEIPSIHHDVTYSQTIAEPEVEFLKPGSFQAHNPVKVRKVVDTRSDD